MGFPHFLRKYSPVISRGYDGTADSFLFPHPKSGDKGTDTDSGSPQIVNLVNLKTGVDLSGIA